MYLHIYRSSVSLLQISHQGFIRAITEYPADNIGVCAAIVEPELNLLLFNHFSIGVLLLLLL